MSEEHKDDMDNVKEKDEKHPFKCDACGEYSVSKTLGIDWKDEGKQKGMCLSCFIKRDLIFMIFGG